MVFLKKSCPWMFYFSQINVFTACNLSKIYLQSETKAWFDLAQHSNFNQKIRVVPWKQLLLIFKNIKRTNFQFLQNLWKINLRINFFTGVFQGFWKLFRNTCLKERLWVATSVYFNREISLGSTYFLRKYYFREYLNVKIRHSKLFQGEYLFRGGSTYLLVNSTGRVGISQ